MNIAPQIRLNKMQFGIFAGLLIMFVGMQNCSNVGFSTANGSDSSLGGSPGAGNGAGNGPGNGAGPVNTCNQTTLQNLTTPVKILAVVDTSGSNAGDSTHPGTDPDKSKRGGSMTTFYNDFGGKQNFFWSMITFQGSSAMAIINNGNNTQSPAFTSNGPTVQQAIQYFYGMTDQGQTPYKAALTLAQSAIANDPSDTSQTKYIIVFLSDGLPTDYTNDAQIDSDVTSLINIKPGRISFSTVYYGPSDATASGRLQAMASAGQGQFLDTNQNPTANNFLINNVVTVPGSNCPH